MKALLEISEECAPSVPPTVEKVDVAEEQNEDDKENDDEDDDEDDEDDEGNDDVEDDKDKLEEESLSKILPETCDTESLKDARPVTPELKDSEEMPITPSTKSNAIKSKTYTLEHINVSFFLKNVYKY